MTGLEIAGLICAIVLLLPIVAFFVSVGCWSGDAHRDYIAQIREWGYGEGKADWEADEEFKNRNKAIK